MNELIRPSNPLIQPQGSDTLRRAAAVLRLLEGIRPDESTDDEGIGLAAILRCVTDAIEYEAERAV